MDEKDKLVEFADALRSKLAYFDELERLSAQFHSGTMSVDVDNFLPVLHRLDECITWVPLLMINVYGDSVAALPV